jgi:hypothetical protein
MSKYLLPPVPPALPEQRWFQLLVDRVLGTTAGVLPFTSLGFVGSNLTSLATRNHNDLQTIQGGAAADYQHLTTAQVGQIATLVTTVGANTTQLTGLAGGLTTTITTAKLTTTGANGSMTFANGVLTAQVAAT